MRHVYVIVSVERDSGKDDPGRGIWCVETLTDANALVRDLCHPHSELFPKYYARLAGRYDKATGPLRAKRKKV